MGENIIEKALLGASVFKNEETLHPAFVPPELPNREDQLVRLGHDFKPLLNKDGAYAVNVAVVGKPGTGKTVSIRYFGRGLEKAAEKRGIKVRFEYYDCFMFRTKSAILRDLLTERFKVTSRGFSDEEITTMINRRLSRENLRLVLCLDEAYLLGQDLLSIIHASEVAKHGEAHISTLIACRVVDWQNTLSFPLSGRLHDRVDMPSYTEEELYEIFKFRSSLAFHKNVVPDDILHMVANVAAATQNARHGIEMLYWAGKAADRYGVRPITPDLIRRAKQEVYSELRSDVLYGLRDQEILVLAAVSRQLKFEKSSSTSIAKVFDSYQLICEEFGATKQALPTFRKTIDALVTLGIIGKVVESVGAGRRGRRARLTLMDIPVEVFDERVSEILQRRQSMEDAPY
ncbi:MAG: Cdc6/Cdc18 family protein [Candidatus Thorarchaeota archaeon]